MNDGFIIIHRSLNTWGWRTKPNVFSVFIDFLLNANFERSEHLGVVRERGQLTTSINAICLRTGLSNAEVRTAIKCLKLTNEIATENLGNCSLITITKYDDYQSNSKVISKPLAKSRQSVSKVLATTNKDNKDNKDNKETIYTLKHSPLADLVDDPDIKKWLLTGSAKLQQKLFDTYKHSYLSDKIEEAYFWQLETRPSKAGTFLSGWVNRDKDKQYLIDPLQKKIADIFLSQGCKPESMENK